MKISVAIPTYEMYGRGAEFLDFSFQKLAIQKFKDFEVVVSDHSQDKEVLKTCVKWEGLLRINYLYNPNQRGSSSANLNNAILNCKGDYIKILFQDDFLFDENSLLNIGDFADTSSAAWIASACTHTNNGITTFNDFYPKWNDQLKHGINTISSPSVITFRNFEDKIYFDDSLLWLMDVDFYSRMYEKYGEPLYLNKITIVNRIWDGSVSNKLPDSIKQKEVIDSFGGKNA